MPSLGFISPEINLDVAQKKGVAFEVAQHHLDVDSPNNSLQVFISTNYDGSTAGISTATWTPLTFATPSANDVIVSSGNIDISAYNSNNVRIAFKYTGSKTGGVTTTCQLDNIKITKN